MLPKCNDSSRRASHDLNDVNGKNMHALNKFCAAKSKADLNFSNIDQNICLPLALSHIISKII